MLFVNANVSFIANSLICKVFFSMFSFRKILFLLYVCTIGHTFYVKRRGFSIKLWLIYGL